MSINHHYNKGSEWRKWDLHLHTPNTHLNDNYSNQNGEDIWFTYSQRIENSDVAVFGITDYFSFNNYFTFIEKHKVFYPESKKVFFLNIEFRLDVSVNRNAEEVNLHIIFSYDISKDKLTEFLTKLNTNITRLSCPVPCINLLDNEFDRAAINYANLEKVCKEVFGKEKNYLIFAASNNAGIRPDTNSPRKLNISDEIDKTCDGFFGGSQNTDYYLKIDRLDSGECIKQKPVISGCDAHSFSDLDNWLGKQVNSNSANKQVTWIKADTTFEGLKQIIFEPKDRVRIQEEKPEIKDKYLVIDKVRFIDGSKLLFSDDWIELNPNLNSIIGGKSSGKSLLLYHIAKTINPQRLDEINSENTNHKCSYDFESNSNFDFEVKWEDGEHYSLKDSQTVIKNRQITYIPQLYLNRLAEDKRNELNNIVEEILLKNSNYNIFRKEQQDNINQINQKISSEIGIFFLNIDLLSSLQIELQSLGDKEAIFKSITMHKTELDELKKQLQLSDSELKQYDTTTQKISFLKENQNKIQIFQKFYSDISESLNELSNEIIPDIFEKSFQDIMFNYGDDNTKLKILKILKDKLLFVLNKEIQNYLNLTNLHQVHIENRVHHFEEIILDYNKTIDSIKEKLSNKERLTQIEEKIKDEQEKYNKIIKKEQEIVVAKKQIIPDKVTDLYSQLFKIYNDIIFETNALTQTESYNFELKVSLSFDIDKFYTLFCENIAKKSLLENQFDGKFNGNDFNFHSETHLENIKYIFDKLLISNDIKLNKGFDKKKIVYSLFDDYFSLYYDIFQNNDKLLDMSPGKRGIILFQLFLNLSTSSNPILIDQPEDSLDNRTVYLELNEFIKQKKIDRQIIIVSHNPNLVVSTDSENVIVANQDGQNKESQKRKYQFEYVSGGIENSWNNEDATGILYQKGIREHICEILEGGKEAFEKRESKYGYK